MTFLWLFVLLGSVYSYGFNELVFIQSSFSYELCDTYQAFNIENVELIPSAPVKGQNLTVTVKGNLERDIDYGVKLKSLFKFRNIPLWRQTFDVCKELDDAEDAPMKCPIDKGYKYWTYTFNIPNNLPSGNYQINANITDTTSELLFCSKISFTL